MALGRCVPMTPMRRQDTTTFSLSPITITIDRVAEGDAETFRHCHCDEASEAGDKPISVDTANKIAALLQTVVHQIQAGASANAAAASAANAAPPPPPPPHVDAS